MRGISMLGVMLNLMVAAVVSVGAWLAVPGGDWQPAPADVQVIRSQVRTFVEREALKQHLRLERWESYTFQYQGTHLHGHRVVLANAFCEPPPAYATKQLVAVEDGGPCYFQLWWDPLKKSFVGILFNGFG